MKRMLFNATQAEELRVAIVDGQTLLDLDIETLGKEQRKGNIYKGVITRIEPSLEACFVDYGTDRHGFLPFKEVSRSYFQDYEGGRARIQDVLKEGMQVIVQVEKDERGNKGAALTTFISLAGRYLVLMPNNPRGGGVSRRIEGEDRQELKAAMAELDVPRGMSLIARTAGIGRSVEELQWDFNYLQQLWHAIEEAGRAHNEPYLLFMESSLLIRAIRDYFRPDIGEILVDNPDVHAQVSEFMSYVMPNNAGRLKLYEDHTPLFSRFQIEHQIESAFARSVSLPSGGAIVIDHTEALVSIDVNSARATRGADIEETAFKTNMEAAEEVARQMRLRDLGGLVVIDFIDMENPKHQRDVENVLRDALKKDRARVQMGKLSRFGLLELSRQRLKPALGESSHIACPRCAGTGVIRSIESTALHVLRIIQEEAMKDNTGEVHAQVPVDVATFLLNEKRAELFGLEERLDVSVFLIPNIHLENPHYEITRVRVDDVDEDAAPSYKRVAEPEADESAKPFGGEKAKAAYQEPAVKGVKHTQPAPIVEKTPEKTSLWGSLKSWFGKLFASSDSDEKREENAKNEKRGAQQQRQGKRRPNQRRQHQRRNHKHHDTEQDTDVQVEHVKTAVKEPAKEPQRETRNHNRRNQNEQAQRSARPQVEAVDAPVEVKQEKGNNRRRRNNRSHDQQAAEEMASVNAVDFAQAEVVEAEAPVVSETPKGGREHENKGNRRRNDANRNQRDRRSNSKKRYVPSAAKIERYLSIAEAGEKVRFAVAHVFGESLPSELAVAVPVVAEAAQPQPVFQEFVEIKGNDAGADDEKAMLATAIENAHSAIGHVIGLQVTPETETVVHAVEQATLPKSAPQVEMPVEQQVEVKAQPEAVSAASFEHIDLGGLQLVQTRADAMAEAAAQAQPKQLPGLRRSDMPKHDAAEEVPVTLVQVETSVNR